MNNREFLISRGWVETNRQGPWRWYRPDWKPVSFYTFKDALSLEIAMLKVPRVVRES